MEYLFEDFIEQYKGARTDLALEVHEKTRRV